jgi:hypothetical protein
MIQRDAAAFDSSSQRARSRFAPAPRKNCTMQGIAWRKAIAATVIGCAANDGWFKVAEGGAACEACFHWILSCILDFNTSEYRASQSGIHGA